jgi:hypothetical protein
MTTLDLQKTNLIVILLDIMLLSIICFKYKRYWLWFIPIYVLLLHGMIFGIIFTIDIMSDKIVNPIFYNSWSSILHIQDKTTIAVYAIAVLLKDWNVPSIKNRLKIVEIKVKKLMETVFPDGGKE